MNIKPHTIYKPNLYAEKYPVYGKIYKQPYLVRIIPFGYEDTNYNNRCHIELYKVNKYKLNSKVSRLLIINNNDKIRIDLGNNEYKDIDLQYNMINMTNVIIEQYEENNKNKLESLNKIEQHLKDFTEWESIYE